MNTRLAVILTLTLISLGACAKPEGPAERMGRSIDEMSQSFKDLSKEWDEQDQERQRQLKLTPTPAPDSYDYNRKSDRVVPDHDPYYDTPPGTPEHY